ncbi:hypothetical protein [Flavobacterium sp. PL002]|uniref:hypothetical protein n=1 Tax=Flavobacterium sp. PL002 TaxID=1897058 RepID=UPI00178804DE|nr:hypothetical protein [Flavobacterium sp. PL002]MBE0391305.1 hypothetical protein [Flavobacterium sp. PL002]
MKIITRVFLDGKFISQDEIKQSGQVNRLPDSEVIAKNIDKLRNSEENVWGYLILIHENGISNSPLSENDLIINI